MKARDSAHRRYYRTRNPVHYEYYKTLRNEVNRAIKREKAVYFSYRCSIDATNKKKLWKEIRNLNLWNQNNNVDIPGDLADVDAINKYFRSPWNQNNNVDIPGDLADVDAINKYFRSPVAVPLKDIPNVNSNHYRTAHDFHFKATTPDVTLKALGKFKSNATGPDSINAKALNMCVSVLMDYLIHIFHFCIENSQFPKIWKSSIIRPLPKTSNVKSLYDLRPTIIVFFLHWAKYSKDASICSFWNL
ncbi:hypothetical protein QE152_g4330 [Popillia japonica]|uniref:Uncharacterized protein n=1 Tax=Popillia japonica TaxID=7064 RepID=A0AAW1N333_POPJA